MQSFQLGLIYSFNVQMCSAALGLLASLLLLRPICWRPFYFPVIALVPVGLILILALQVSFGLMSYWQQHFLIGLYLFWALLMMLLATELCREFELAKIVPVLAWVVFIAGVISAVITIVKPISVSVGVVERLNQSKQLANYLALSLASLFYLLHTKRVPISVAMMTGTLLLLALVISHQYLSWLYLAILSIATWLSIKDKRVMPWQSVWLIAIFVIWQLLLPQISILGDHVFSKALHSTSLSLYWQYLDEAWQIFLSYPLLGSGWGQFGWQDLQLAEAYPQHTGWIKHPHNLILQLLAEIGLVGTGIFILGLAFWLKHALQESQSIERKWLFTTLSLLFVYAMFDDGLSDLHVLGLFALMLGLLEVRVYKVLLELGHLIAGLVMILSGFALYHHNAQYKKLQYWYAQNNFERIADNQARPMLTQMGKLRHQSLLTPYIDLAIVRALPNSPALVNDKLSLNTQLIQHSPNAQEAYNQAELLALAGKTTQAKQQLQRALIRHPDHLYNFTMRLLKNQTKETLPLLHMIVRHNRQFMQDQKNQKNPKVSGKNS
ncbi:MAG: Wzy polymerase domain-containing protein [Methylophilus sp.]|nr:Wzy polymerase domain-containing protein [Methylophilus sp.]